MGAARGLCSWGCSLRQAGGDLGGMVAGPWWEAVLDRPPAAQLGFLGFHSSIILIFPLSKLFLIKKKCVFLSPFLPEPCLAQLSEPRCICSCLRHPLIQTKDMEADCPEGHPSLPASPGSPSHPPFSLDGKFGLRLPL